jgi:hypothetical protein
MAKDKDTGAAVASPPPSLNKMVNTGRTQPAPALAPDVEYDPRLAIGEATPGRQIYLVSLKGHKSLVWDGRREVHVTLDVLPVWALNEGEAQMLFQRYNGIVATQNTYAIAARPETIIAA